MVTFTDRMLSLEILFGSFQVQCKTLTGLLCSKEEWSSGSWFVNESPKVINQKYKKVE